MADDNGMNTGASDSGTQTINLDDILQELDQLDNDVTSQISEQARAVRSMRDASLKESARNAMRREADYAANDTRESAVRPHSGDYADTNADGQGATGQSGEDKAYQDSPQEYRSHEAPSQDQYQDDPMTGNDPYGEEAEDGMPYEAYPDQPAYDVSESSDTFDTSDGYGSSGSPRADSYDRGTGNTYHSADGVPYPDGMEPLPQINRQPRQRAGRNHGQPVMRTPFPVYGQQPDEDSAGTGTGSDSWDAYPPEEDSSYASESDAATEDTTVRDRNTRSEDDDDFVYMEEEPSDTGSRNPEQSSSRREKKASRKDKNSSQTKTPARDEKVTAVRASKRDMHAVDKNGKVKKSVPARIGIALLIILIIAAAAWFIGLPLYRMYEADQELGSGSYDAAIAGYEAVAAQPLGRLFGTDARIREANYQKAVSLKDAGQYDDAVVLLQELGSYKDSESLLHDASLQRIDLLISAGSYNQALDALGVLDDSYEGRDDLVKKARLGRAQVLVTEGKLENAISELTDIQDYEGAADALHEAQYQLALDDLAIYDFTDAAQLLTELGDYKDASQLLPLAQSAFDAVYQSPYINNDGQSSDTAISYLWVHTAYTADSYNAALSMQEDYSIGDVNAQYFGSSMLNYVQYTQPQTLEFTFSYGGSELDSEEDRDTYLHITFADSEFNSMTSDKEYGDTWEAIEHPQTREWTRVTDSALIDTIKSGFRAKIAVDLARRGNAYFADSTDGSDVTHYCCQDNCTNEGTLVASDTTSRAYYCEDHREEYEADERTVAKENSADTPAGSTIIPAVFTQDDTTAQFQNINSSYAILVNVDTNRVIAAKNADEKMYPASMTKIMTILVAAEHLADANLGDTVTITDDIINTIKEQNLSAVGFQPGEVVTVRDCLWGTVLPSGADAALALGRYIAGSDDAFVELMNQKASDLGLTDTHFTNDIGIYDDDHYSTAHDMAVILQAATQNQLAFTVLSTVQYTTSITPDIHPAGLTIENRFLRRMAAQDIPGLVFAAKTGYVKTARACCASYEVDNNGQHYICVTAQADNSWKTVYDQRDIYQVYTGVREEEETDGTTEEAGDEAADGDTSAAETTTTDDSAGDTTDETWEEEND